MIKLQADKERPTKEKMTWTKGRKLGCLAWVIAIPLVVVACTSGGSDDKPKVEHKAKVEAKAEQPKPKHTGKDDGTNWQFVVQDKTLHDDKWGGKTGVVDEVMGAARKADFSAAVVNKFEKEIVNDYKSKKYLTNNDPTKMEHLFMATVVEHWYDDKLGYPIDKFAFDYLQNLKDTYRGINDSVQANEQQMNKILPQLAY